MLADSAFLTSGHGYQDVGRPTSSYMIIFGLSIDSPENFLAIHPLLSFGDKV
jgi:hypothetical protein